MVCVFSGIYGNSGNAWADDFERISKDLASDNWKTRFAAVQKLGTMRDDARTVDMLMKVADDKVEYWPVKIEAIKILGEIGNPKSVDVILSVYNDTFLNNECPSIKSFAAAALGGFKSERRIVEALIEGINDPEVLTREAAIQSLGKLKDPRAVPPLINALNDRNYTVRLNAIISLGKIQDPQAIPHLRKISTVEQDQVLKDTALLALKSFPSEKER
jgi:HEAT repeat protein